MPSEDLSAGLLMYRNEPALQVYLVHPGGPFFKNKDEGFWTIPKGLIDEDEDLFHAAVREFKEETQLEPETNENNYIELGKITQKAGKVVYAWAFRTDRSEAPAPASNHFEMEWPPNSGNFRKFPEVDQADFFDLDTAYRKINDAQHVFIDRLQQKIT